MSNPTKTTVTHPETQAPKTPAVHRPDATASHNEVRGTDPVLDSLRRIEGALAAMRGEWGVHAGPTSGAVRGRGTTASAAIEAGLLGLDLPPGQYEAAVTIVRGALLGPDEDAVMRARRAPLRP